MKRFHCPCGHPVFFDDSACLGCGRPLGFDAETLAMALLEPGSSAGDARMERSMKRCRSYTDYGICNWLLPSDASAELCVSCGSSQVIPNLGRADNLALWTKVEQAKRRLFYSLISLRLVSAVGSARPGPMFRILEDRRRNPDVAEDFVPTGYANGVITLNLLEADDSARHAQREQFHERYRTVLGHLRHESGHFFFERLTAEPANLAACRRLFGDEREPYDEALRDHYQNGPRSDWSDWHVSAYASVHPREDFAESFAHYMLIVDALETTRAAGLESSSPATRWVDRWIDMAVTLNELSRSLGVEDAYPFVLTPPVIEKLELVDELVRGGVAAR